MAILDSQFLPDGCHRTLRQLAQTIIYPRSDLGRAIEWKSSSERRHMQRLVYEDEEVRRDPSDGLLRFKPEGGVTINQGGSSFQTNQSFVSVVKVNDIYVYCMSRQLSSELANRFESPFCVEIKQPIGILGRIRRKVRVRSHLDHNNVLARPVDYRDLDQEPGADWALPERLAFIKPKAFVWQDEFRIVIGKKGSLGIENVDLLLEGEGTAHTIELEERDPLVLELGDLSQITELHCL